VSPRLRIDVEARPYAPGEMVRGEVSVLEGGGSRDVEVSLNYHEKTQDYDEIARSVPGGRLHTGDLRTGDSLPFEIQLPMDATPQLIGAGGRLYWALDVRSDEFGLDTRESVPIVIGEAKKQGRR
jgi:hypothetical protein